MIQEEEKQMFAARFRVSDLGFERKKIDGKLVYQKIGVVSEEVQKERARFDLLFGFGFRCEYEDIKYIQKDKKETTVFFHAEKKYFQDALKDPAHKQDRTNLEWANEFSDYVLHLSTKNISKRTLNALIVPNLLDLDFLLLITNMNFPTTLSREVCDGKKSYADGFSLHKVGFFSSDYNLYFTRISSIEQILELEKKLNIFRSCFADFKIYPKVY